MQPFASVRRRDSLDHESLLAPVLVAREPVVRPPPDHGPRPISIFTTSHSPSACVLLGRRYCVRRGRYLLPTGCASAQLSWPGGVKLYGPSHAQGLPAGVQSTRTLAWNPLNRPVPPGEGGQPIQVTVLSVTWP